MAIADFQAVKDSIEKGKPYCFSKNSMTPTSNRFMSLWTIAPKAGAIPSVAAACNADTAGALLSEPKLTTLTKSYYPTQLEIGCFSSSPVSLILADRLVHQGGLSGTATGAQTINLPTAALPRYTDGTGVMMGLEVYSALGSTPQTVTLSYTNRVGLAGRTSKPVLIGGSNDNAVSRFFPIPVDDFDLGVLSVESVTLSASTDTAGNFGVTLFKPLMLIPNIASLALAVQPRCLNNFIGGYGCCPEIRDDACLMLLLIVNSSSSSGVVQGAFHLAEA